MALERLLITGYKASELGIFGLKHPGIPIIQKAIAKTLSGLAEEGLEWAVVSGQWGVELWAAEAVLQLRQEAYPGLRLAVITAYEGQDESWSEEKREWYQGLLAKADYTACVTRRKYEGPWQFKEKDRFLIRNTDGILLLYDEEKEGSPRYIKAEAERTAAVRPYSIFTITAQDLQDMADEETPNWE